MTMEVGGASHPLKALAPQLRRLCDRCTNWRRQAGRRPFGTDLTAAFDQHLAELDRMALELEQDSPLLVVVLMGGTGVGKSTLLNALARGHVAPASFARPTTRDAIVYLHSSVDGQRLDPRLQLCRLVRHDRPLLAQKVIVDTPDLDSNEASHREKLRQVLPVADVVLYVGSQEKYHDQVGWELFLEQRQRRAFAFVLNKWDRCLQGLTSGLRPDEDLLRDLREEGFEAPLLFRTCAQAWIDAEGIPGDLPPGEEFADLERWLEQGLTRLEIEAIKTKGVAQLLAHMDATLARMRPPEITEAVRSTTAVWQQTLAEEAEAITDLILITLDPFQRDLERMLAVQIARLFRGPTAAFIRFCQWLRYLGSSWRRHWPRSSTPSAPESQTHASADLAGLVMACTQAVADRHLDARERALPNRLLVQADVAGLPISALNELMSSLPTTNWRARVPGLLRDCFEDVAKSWQNSGQQAHLWRRGLIWFGNALPLGIVMLTSVLLLADYFLASPRRSFTWSDLFLPFAAAFLALVVFVLLLNLLLPSRWPAIRSSLRRRLCDQVLKILRDHYLSLPAKLSSSLAAERAAIDALRAEIGTVRSWIDSQEKNTQVTALYGRD